MNGTFVGGSKEGYMVIDLSSTARTAGEGSMRTVRVGIFVDSCMMQVDKSKMRLIDAGLQVSVSRLD